MTSFGATEMVQNNAVIGQQFNSTFKNQRPSLSQSGLIAINVKQTTYIFTNLLYGR